MCMWWSVKGVLHYELLQSDERVTADRYEQQLNNLSDDRWNVKGNILAKE